MTMYKTISKTAEEKGISAYTLRKWCKEGKIRYNIAGNSKYILREDWLEEDLQKMAMDNMGLNNEKDMDYGKLRKIKG